MTAQRILAGEIGRPHGVRGLVKLRSFLSGSVSMAELGPLTDASGEQQYALVLKADGLAQIEGVTDREGAAKLTGTRLYAARDQLPAPDAEEFYIADLVGLAAVGEDDKPLGIVQSVEDHGAGAYLVLGGGSSELLVPFNRASVPHIDVSRGRIVVRPPAEIDVRSQNGEAAA